MTTSTYEGLERPSVDILPLLGRDLVNAPCTDILMGASGKSRAYWVEMWALLGIRRGAVLSLRLGEGEGEPLLQRWAHGRAIKAGVT